MFLPIVVKISELTVQHIARIANTLWLIHVINLEVTQLIQQYWTLQKNERMDGEHYCSNTVLWI